MEWVQFVITILCSILASSGLWAMILKKMDSKDVKTKMLIGLAHDRIIFLGMRYIERGWITDDEYENLYDYLYYPYKQMGGNGSAERVMEGVKKLQIRHVTPIQSQTSTYSPGGAIYIRMDEEKQ